jgi:hypothetical protein
MYDNLTAPMLSPDDVWIQFRLVRGGFSVGVW